MGAVQVYAGLTLVQKIGAGPFVGLTVTTALITSLVVDHYGGSTCRCTRSTLGEYRERC